MKRIPEPFDCMMVKEDLRYGSRLDEEVIEVSHIIFREVNISLKRMV